MLIGEYDYDTDIAVQRESFEIGLAEGEARGKSIGLAEGGARGSRQKAFEMAKLIKLEAFDIGMITKITGLFQEELEAILFEPEVSQDLPVTTERIRQRLPSTRHS